MKLSKITFFCCATLLLFSGSVFYPRWQQPGQEAQLSWDAGGYYWYLPSVFIYNDIKGQAFKDRILQKYKPSPPEDFQYAVRDSTSHNYVVRYTLGTAILESPFFFIAHIAAKPLGYPADGFSRPYQFMVYLGGVLFALLGLWYLRKLLLLYYSDKVVAIVLLLLVFGTNYLNYSGIDVGMTHGWLFTLYVFILLNTHYYYTSLKRKYALRLGFLIGLAALIRPPEIISALIPMLWGINRLSLPVFKDRLSFFRQRINTILFAVIICVLTISLQFLYWHYATGKWFIYTYRDQGFSWLSPNIKQYTLNYQCGWLTYTPMMFFAIAGIFPFIKQGKNKVVIVAVILVNYYIVASWDAWEYGGRAMIQNYPLLLFPLASFIELLTKKRVLAWIFFPILLLFGYYNIWWTYQAHNGTIIGGAPTTRRYFWHTIFRYNVPLDIQKLRDNNDLYSKEVRNPVVLYTNNLNGPFPAGNFIIANDKQQSFDFGVKEPKHKWLRATADFHIDGKEWNVWFMTQFIIRLKKGKNVLQENSIRVQRLLNDGETKNISLDCKVRDKDFDHVELLFRNDNNGSAPCTIDNIVVIGFNE